MSHYVLKSPIMICLLLIRNETELWNSLPERKETNPTCALIRLKWKKKQFRKWRKPTAIQKTVFSMDLTSLSPLLINMWSSYVLAHYKESHGPLGSEDGALRAAGPNEPYELLDSRTPSEAPFSRQKTYLFLFEDNWCLHASAIKTVAS